MRGRKLAPWLALALVVVVAIVVLVVRSRPDNSPAARAARLEHQLACPVCDGQSVADSNSPQSRRSAPTFPAGSRPGSPTPRSAHVLRVALQRADPRDAVELGSRHHRVGSARARGHRSARWASWSRCGAGVTRPRLTATDEDEDIVRRPGRRPTVGRRASGHGLPLRQFGRRGRSMSERSTTHDVDREKRDEQREHEELEAEREFLLRSLDDLDAELLAGNIDPDTYRVLHDDYTARASAVIRSIADGVERGSPGRGTVPPWTARVFTIGGIVVFALLAAFLLAHTAGQRSRARRSPATRSRAARPTTVSRPSRGLPRPRPPPTPARRATRRGSTTPAPCGRSISRRDQRVRAAAKLDPEAARAAGVHGLAHRRSSRRR